MILIRASLPNPPPALPAIDLPVDRLTLAKRRWRGIADDSVEFGFDLDSPLHHESVFFSSGQLIYRIRQLEEPVLEIELISNPAPVARLAWAIGNFHFPIQVTATHIRIQDDLALRQFLAKERIPFLARKSIFEPFGKSHGHE